MAASGATPIILYHSTTGAAVPSNANLAPGELAVNIADMKLYCENGSGVVTLLSSADAAAGNFTTVDTTNIEVTNIKAKDGTAAIAIADSTGVTTQSTPAIISVNSSSDALRITQIGAGNALLVEDSANPDASPFVITSIGSVGIGLTSPENVLHVIGQGIFDRTGTTSASQPQQINQRRKRDADAILANGDDISTLASWGWDGSAYILATSILSEVDGTPGTNDMPGRLVFSTTADGASTPTEAMRITNARNVLVGGTAVRGTTVGTAHIDLFNGTAPAGTLTNGVSLYSSSGDFNFIDAAGGAYKVGYRNVPAVGTKTASYTLAVGDVGKYVQIGSGGSITIPDATFSEGDVVSLFNNTTGDITVTCTITTAYIAGTDEDKATVTLATRGVATILFISGTVCVIGGNVS
jgi:hypothetical protein